MRRLRNEWSIGSRLIAIVLVFFLPLAASSQTPSRAVGPNSKEGLVKRYLTITHSADFFRKTYASQLRLAWNICKDKACQSDLDRAIGEAMNGVSQQYEERLSKLFAEKLTEGELHAIVKFAESPEGQSIIRVREDMSDEAARLGHTTALAAQDGISQRFCLMHADHCTAEGKIAMPPRSATAHR